MIEKLLAGAIPVLLSKVAELPSVDKRKFVQFISDMCALYLTGDKPAFSYWLSETKLPSDMQQGIVKALWSDGTVKREDQNERPAVTGR